MKKFASIFGLIASLILFASCTPQSTEPDSPGVPRVGLVAPSSANLTTDVSALQTQLTTIPAFVATNPASATGIDGAVLAATTQISSAMVVTPVPPNPPPVPNGKPSAINRGLTNPSLLHPYTGPSTVTTPGAAIVNADISGQIFIKAHGVTFSNCRLNGQMQGYGFDVLSPAGGAADPSGPSVVISDCEITNTKDGGIFGSNWTAQRCYIHDVGADATDGSWNIKLLDSYIHNIGSTPGSHADGYQTANGQNILIQGNFFDIPSHSPDGIHKSNSCIFLEPPAGSIIKNVTVDGNWLTGGNYVLYAAGPGITGVTFTDNILGPEKNMATGEQFGYIYQGWSSIVGLVSGNKDSSGNVVP